MTHRIYLTTPNNGGVFPFEYVNGICSTLRKFGERIDPHVAKGSFLPQLRDLMFSRFLASGLDYMLSVDSDMGWAPSDIDELLAADVDLVSGVYTKKDGKGAIIVRLAPGETFATNRMLRCDGVPGGFFLLKRAAAQRMADHFAGNRYTTDGEATFCLHNPILEDGAYYGEDYSFCRRFRESGGEIWMHPGVVLRHVGSTVFLPGLTE